jgi:hypothetical protein
LNSKLRTNLKERLLLFRDRSAFGILSDDTDFLLYEGHGARVYSAQHLDLKTLTTRAYNRSAVAAHLNLHPRHLPVLAILKKLGDAIHENCPDPCRCSGTQQRKNIPALAYDIEKEQLAPQFEDLLAKLPSVLRSVLGKRIGESHVSDAVKMLQTYFLQATTEVECATLTPEWLAVTKRFRESVCSYKDVICFQELFSGVLLEDYASSDIPFVAHQLLPFRQRLYGVLLRELPPEKRFVREWCYAGPGSVTAEGGTRRRAEELPAELHHPGMLALLDREDRSPEKQAARIELFAYVVSPRLLELHDIRSTLLSSPESVFLICQLFYAQHEVEDKPLLHDWEVMIFIMAPRLMVSKSHEDVRQQLLARDGLVPDARGAQLAAGFNRFPLVKLNCVLGEPFDTRSLLVQCNFGGKIFHRLYKMAKAEGNVVGLIKKFRLENEGIEDMFTTVTSKSILEIREE